MGTRSRTLIGKFRLISTTKFFWNTQSSLKVKGLTLTHPSSWTSSVTLTTAAAASRLPHTVRHFSSSDIQGQSQADGGEASQATADAVIKSVKIDADDPERLLKQQESEEQEYEHSVKQRILRASLNHVHDFGWTKKALQAGAASEGLPSVSHGMFPKGGVELINFFYEQSNLELGDVLRQQVEKAKQDGLEKPKTGPFIKDAIEIRLRMILPYLDHWPQAMAIQALPQNAPTSWCNLINVADEIWYHAGDRSTDFTWYTKRVSLAGIYKASEIFLLQDKSLDHQDTWAFVDRRMEDLVTLGTTKQSLQKTTSALKECLKGFAIMSRNMTGINSRDR